MSNRLTAKKQIAKSGTVARWGNSLAVRIPREAVLRLQLKDGASISFEIGADSLIIRPTRRRKKWTEAQLLKGVTSDMVKGEIDWGGSVGREAL